MTYFTQFRVMAVTAIALFLSIGIASQAYADHRLEFDDTILFGGTISGDDTSITGTDIVFDQVLGINTDLNDGVALDCDCLLNFTIDGGSAVSGTTVDYTGSGSFTVTGTVTDPNDGDAVVASGTILTGTIENGTFSLFGNTAIFGGTGTDTKNQDLLDYYGIFVNEFEFVNTELSLNNCSGSLSGFTCSVDDADLVNSVVAEPGTLGLLGIGLLGMGFFVRRRVNKAA